MRRYLVFASVLLVTLLSCAGIAMPYPILAPLFMADTSNGLNSFMGISAEMLFGIAMAVYPLGIFIGGSFIGALSDSYGRKKILVTTLLVSIVGYLLTVYAILEQHYLLFIGARFFTGLCEGNISIARAIALDMGKFIDKTRAMSLIGAAGFGGWLIGPLMGGYLAVYGPEMAFAAAAIAVFFCMTLVIAVIEETHKVAVNKPFLHLLRSHNSLHLLKIPSVRPIFLFHFTFTLGLNAFYEFYPVWLVKQRNYLSSDIGETTAIMTVCMTLTSLLLVTRVKRTLGLHTSLLLSTIAAGVIMAILPFTAANEMVVLFALTGMAIAFINGLLPVFASHRIQTTDSDESGHAPVGNGALMGLITVTFCIANTIISLLGAWALKAGPAVPMYLGSGLVLLSSALLVRIIYAKVEHSVISESL